MTAADGPRGSSISLSAFCKVNLCLEITGRRDDGYHDLATVFQSVSLADAVTIEAREEPGLSVSVPDGGAPEGAANLCWQAAEAYQAERGWPGGVAVTLDKRVPSGAGLGGGSSDAAAVLRGLAELDRAPLSQSVLEEIARGLGADVPFFLTGGTAVATGRGDQITSLPDLPACRILLVRPDLEISTAEAFGMLSESDFTDGERASSMADAIAAGAAGEIPAHVFNGFSRVLEERWPVLGELKRAMADHGAIAAEITGSGSAVFGIFDDHAAALASGEALAERGHWARLTEPVPCGTLMAE
ncbi:MAG: 4-(cytidine 5'-diphospho)-2-C-methyl-D-erythritol kinase [Armatimonadota bacterium]